MRAIDDRPYIHAGGAGVDGRFSGRGTRPLREDGRLGGFAVVRRFADSYAEENLKQGGGGSPFMEQGGSQ